MNHGNHRIWLSILLTSVLIAARQLPPEIMADRHMVRLNRLISENRHREAYRLTGEIAEFYEKHSLELPHEFHFKQARIVSSLGLLKEAITALHTYLNKAGKEGARYLDALDLLDRTEEELREAEAERKRIEAERRRAEAIRKQHTDLVNRQIQAASVRLARDPLRSGGLGPEMVTVAKGGFHYPYRAANFPLKVQWVEIDRPFAISKYEVTRGEFRRFVKASRYRTEAERGPDCPGTDGRGTYSRNNRRASWKRPGFFQTDSHPVVCVSRSDAMAYAKWLSRESGQSYRLPTAVEWQYAARAGSDFAMLDKGRRGAERPKYCGRANLRENSGEVHPHARCVDDGVERTAQVGSFPPNDIGLHDTIGNVEEWVSSCFFERKGLLPHDENDDHCEAQHQVTVGAGYQYGGNRTSYASSDLGQFDKSGVDMGFRLVKDFKLRVEPAGGGNRGRC